MASKRISIVIIIITIIMMSAVSLPFLWNQFMKPEPKDFDGTLAMNWVHIQTNLGARSPGSEAHRLLQEIILKELADKKWLVQVEPCVIDNGLIAYNIVAKHGSGQEWIILGAHYDSRVAADQEIRQENRDLPVPGANDGASGIAVLLELARVLALENQDTEIWLVFFDLEDNGNLAPYGDWILGSTCFVRQLISQSNERLPSAAIIVDMIGDEDLQIYYEVNSNQEIRAEIWSQAIQLGYDQFIPKERYSIIDDHTPFLAAGIPAVDIIDFDYPYWHTLADTPDKVSGESLQAVGRTLQFWLMNR